MRTITIVAANVRKEINTAAKTLGELKNDLSAAGIYYLDKAFFEGLTRTELVDDSSVLPESAKRAGKTTTNIVIMITDKQKNIKNGAVMSRAEIYAYIKEHNLKDKVFEKLGKNFTRCKTSELGQLCNEHRNSLTADRPERVSKRVAKKVTTECNCGKLLEKLINVLCDKNIISKDDVYEYDNSAYSDSDLDKICKGLA